MEQRLGTKKTHLRERITRVVAEPSSDLASFRAEVGMREGLDVHNTI